MRRVFTVLILLSIAGAAAWTLLKWQPEIAGGADPWRAVPAEAAIIIEVPRALATWDRFAHTSLLWRDWEREPGAHRMSAALASLAQRLEEDSASRSAVEDMTALVAMLRSARGANPVFIAPASRGLNAERLGSLFGMNSAQANGLNAGKPLVIAADSSWNGISICYRDGLLLLSPSADALDEALLQLERGTPITSEAAFAEARATLGQATDAHAMVHLGRSRGLLTSIWDAATVERAALPDGWMALDLAARPDALLLNGLFMAAGESEWMKSIAAQGSGSWNVGRLLPADAVQWEIRHIGDAEATAATLAGLDERTRATEFAATWMSGELGTARNADGTQRWLIAGCNDPERAAAELAAPCAQVPCDTLGYRGMRLTRFPEAKPFEQLLGRPCELPHQPWWVLLGDHAVLSDDPVALQRSIDAWNDGGSLAEHPGAKSWFRRMSDEAGLTWWCDLARSGELLKEGLRSDRADDFAQWTGILSNLGGLSVQVSPAGQGRAHVAIGLQHLGNGSAPHTVTSSGGALWTCDVGAPVRRRPELLRNHTNGSLEVLVQDTLNRIHLISASGKTLWSRQLDGLIMGPVHQVDRFKNGKLQMLLSTARTLHLIDRNGKDVGVPHKLSVAASAPVAVFDYENKREYRVLVALEDGRLLNLDLDWAAVQGWETPKLEAPAVAPVHHLRIGGKDYLLAVSRDGSMRLLDRRGVDRQTVKTKLDRPNAVLAVQQGPQAMATRIVWVDSEHVLRATKLSGDTEALNGGRTEDLDGDGIPESVASSTDESVKGVLAAFPLGGDSLAWGAGDPVTGYAWSLRPMRSTAPLRGNLMLGDLNLDGAMEVVGSDGGGTLKAYRLP